MRNPARTSNAVFLLGVVCTLLATGCTRKSTPPGPASSFGIVEPGTHFEFLLWEEGLAILLIDNCTKAHESSGGSSTNDPVYRRRGSAVSEEGYQYSWALETSDGKAANVEIEGTVYDIGDGGVFSVKATNDGVTVEQIDLDLSQLTGIADCQNFIRDNREALSLKSPL